MNTTLEWVLTPVALFGTVQTSDGLYSAALLPCRASAHNGDFSASVMYPNGQIIIEHFPTEPSAKNWCQAVVNNAVQR